MVYNFLMIANTLTQANSQRAQRLGLLRNSLMGLPVIKKRSEELEKKLEKNKQGMFKMERKTELSDSSDSASIA
jgi:hypothetical protein